MEENNINVEEKKTIEFRLSSIEKSIEELKDIIVETKIQQKDINIIYKSIQQLETSLSNLNERIDAIEKKPANRFENLMQGIMSYALSVVIGAVIGYILMKIGLKS